MNTLRTIAALVVAAFLVLGPTVAFAASPTLSIATNAPTYAGQSTIQVTGTVTPAPGASNTAVVITTTGPMGVVDTNSVPVTTGTGAYTYTFVSGGSAGWTTGTYSVNGTWGFGGATASAVTTFAYTGATGTSSVTAAPIINIFVSAASPATAGNTEQIGVMTVWSNNGTLATASTLSATLVAPGATSTSGGTSLGTPAFSSKGEYYWNYAIPSSAGNGAYFIQVLAKDGGIIGWGLGSFTVSTAPATAAQETATQTTLAGISNGMAVLTTSLQSINSDIQVLAGLPATGNSTLSSQLSKMQTSLDGISSGVTGLTSSLSGLSGMSTTLNGVGGQLTTLNSAVGNNQTYVLVVAALAAITLVLELAILVRKLS